MKKILVIDDSQESTTLISHLLKDETGVEVIVYNDEFEALKNINILNPDLILMDVYLNVTDGLKVKTFIDALSPAKIPVVFMSTYETAIVVMGAELAADECIYLQKPIRKENIISLVQNLKIA